MRNDFPSFLGLSRSSCRHLIPCLQWPTPCALPLPMKRRAFRNPLQCVRPYVSACPCNLIYRLLAFLSLRCFVRDIRRASGASGRLFSSDAMSSPKAYASRTRVRRMVYDSLVLKMAFQKVLVGIGRIGRIRRILRKQLLT